MNTVENKKQAILDIKDLVATYLTSAKELRDNPDFRSKWSKKFDRLTKSVELLTPEEYKEVEKEYLEWIGKEFPQVKRTPIFNTKKHLDGVDWL